VRSSGGSTKNAGLYHHNAAGRTTELDPGRSGEGGGMKKTSILRAIQSGRITRHSRRAATA
jgi:hypothetical protein